MNGRHVDVAVVGAGAVGLAAALALARAGCATALVGPAPEGSDGRSAALLAGSLRFLASLGVGPAIADVSAPLASMRIVDDTGSLFRPPPVVFGAGELGLSAFGRNIENAALVRVLAEAARAQPGLTWTEQVATGLGPQGAVLLADGGSVAATLVVAADGRRSRMREAAGITARHNAYPQAALTLVLAHERPHGDTSTEFHTRSGPFTLVPLPGHRSSLVWVGRPEESERLHGLDDAALERAVWRASHGLLGRVRIDGPRGLVPLSLLSVDRLGAGRVVLVGEAAHALPPIGAQGLNLGLADVASLARIVADATGGAGLEPAAVLQRYGRDRMRDVRLRSVAVDGLNRALLSGLLPADAMRGLGLGLLARIGPLRRAVMRAGLASGGLPRGLPIGTD
ncbi:MAG: ubiquinone biosynthesis hydroxylase, UbiH/UbiF/VisC/COQ6 family protein [Enterovirga sp.]|nr:ubiquinone biosynthesis hydroxylase, UbiH/UbiF/VisC/COQ6 family protein [Enterovirga sp.]